MPRQKSFSRAKFDPDINWMSRNSIFSAANIKKKRQRNINWAKKLVQISDNFEEKEELSAVTTYPKVYFFAHCRG